MNWQVNRIANGVCILLGYESMTGHFHDTSLYPASPRGSPDAGRRDSKDFEIVINGFERSIVDGDNGVLGHSRESR